MRCPVAVPLRSISIWPPCSSNPVTSAKGPQAAQPDVVDFGALLSDLGLEQVELGSTRLSYLSIVTQESVSHIHEIGNPGGNASLKATCKSHKSCVCWVSHSSEERRQNILASLVTWLSEGRDATAAAHKESSKEVKRSHGMKVRS